MAINLTVNPAGNLFIDNIDITLSCDTPSAVIQYTLDGNSPLCPLAQVYDGNPIHIEVEEDTDFTLKAVAYTDFEISNRIEEEYTIVYSSGDSDSDGIPNSEEDPGVDTDSDGTPDYLDTDSDNDGISDAIEGTGDYDSDGTPNFRDTDQVPDFIYEFVNWPPTEPLVEYVPYTFELHVKNGSAAMTISEEEDYLIGLDTSKDPEILNVGDVKTFTIMPTICRATDDTSVVFNFSEIPSENVHQVSTDVEIVEYSDSYPLNGVSISWQKNVLAKAYKIYKQGVNDPSMYHLITVQHDPTTSSNTQWYIDRDGGSLDRYSVSAVDDDDVEGIHSLPKHAPDIPNNICLIQGNISNLGMEPLEDICISTRIKEYPVNINNTFIDKRSDISYTDSRGYFEIRVPQNTVIVLAIDSVGFKKELIVPSVYSINIQELLNHPANNI